MCTRRWGPFFVTCTSRTNTGTATPPDHGGEIRREERLLAKKKSTTASAKTAPKAKAAAKSTARSRTTAKTAKANSAVVEVVEVVDQVVEEPESDCKHAWLIEPPNGPTSDGSCTICGMKREFRNSYEYTPSWTARSGKAGAAKASAAKAAAAKTAAAKTPASGKDSK